MSTKVCLIVYLSAHLIVDLTSLKSEAQKPITLNHHNHNHHHQQPSSNANNNASTHQNNKPTQTVYQNYSLAANRPLERPSLTLVSNHNNQQQQHQQNSPPIKDLNSVDAPPDGVAADWFMLGGAGADLMTDESKSGASFSDQKITKRSDAKRKQSNKSGSSNRTVFDDESADSSDSNEIFDDVEESSSSLAGTQKEPECASQGRYYCTYKEDYPLKLVTEVTKYYKWPLEKLFRDLHAQIMPKLAQDSSGNLVCDSITRVVRPGWARNTNERWLVVINTENYHQYVTEVVCQYGTNSRCNFIPPCYYSSCQQRYNTQKLLVIDPTNPYRGPFLSEFLFPSCCVCYVPSTSENFQDKYRSSPATIYQRTMQQESATNVHPPQFRPPGIIEEPPVSHLADQSSISSSRSQTGGAKQNQAAGVGEIRRGGDQHQYRRMDLASTTTRGAMGGSSGGELADFPRLGMADSPIIQMSNRDSSPEVRQ